MITRRRFAVALSALLVAALAPAASAQPKPGPAPQSVPAECTVYEFRASNDKGGIDAGLQPLENKLKRPPFSSWDTFKLLQTHKVQAEYKKQASLKLVTNSKMSLLYKDRVKFPGKKPRLRLQVSMRDGQGRPMLDTTVVVDSGDPWVIGTSEGNGSHFVAIACTIP